MKRDNLVCGDVQPEVGETWHFLLKTDYRVSTSDAEKSREVVRSGEPVYSPPLSGEITSISSHEHPGGTEYSGVTVDGYSFKVGLGECADIGKHAIEFFGATWSSLAPAAMNKCAAAKGYLDSIGEPTILAEYDVNAHFDLFLHHYGKLLERRVVDSPVPLTVVDGEDYILGEPQEEETLAEVKDLKIFKPSLTIPLLK